MKPGFQIVEIFLVVNRKGPQASWVVLRATSSAITADSATYGCPLASPNCDLAGPSGKDFPKKGNLFPDLRVTGPVRCLRHSPNATRVEQKAIAFWRRSSFDGRPRSRESE